MRGINTLQFFPLYQGTVEISMVLEPFLRSWWGNILVRISESDWFEQKVDSLF